jgi:F420-dependent oxidoreductase-like protein
MAALFGFHMPNFTFPDVANDRLFDGVVKNAKAAEKAGFDLVTVMDHFYQIRGIGPETEPMMEAYATLSALATQTSRVRLGTLVTGVTYRNPALLAKQVTTLDVISRGRAILGIGAAWNEDEHNGYGIEFPPIGQRMDRLDEALTIAKLMFTQDRPSFEGKYYKIDRALNVPRPVQPGGPQILIGGTGERRTLRLLAQHGDIGHWFGGNVDEMKRKKQIFEEHCAAVNRDPSEVLLTLGLTLVLAKKRKRRQSPHGGPHAGADSPASAIDSSVCRTLLLNVEPPNPASMYLPTTSSSTRSFTFPCRSMNGARSWRWRRISVDGATATISTIRLRSIEKYPGSPTVIPGPCKKWTTS